MGRISRTIFTLIVAGMVMASCGKSRDPQADGTAMQPKFGGTLIYVKNHPPATLDPALTTESESTIPCDNIFESLVQLKLGTTGTAPALARSWDISDNGITYTFHLRSGVKFHDGTPFNADAVLFNFNRQRDPKHPLHKNGDRYEYWKTLSMDKILKDIKKINDSTVQMTLFEPNATFLYILTMQFLAIASPTSLQKWDEEFSKHPSGTGPFRYVSMDNDGTLTLEANPDYWEGPPYLERVVFLANPDGTDRVKKLLKGEYDMIEMGGAEHFKDLHADPNIKLYQQPGVNIGYLAMNMSKKPFDKLNVRKAVVYAINREKLVDSVLGEMGRVAKNPIPPMLLGYNEEVRPTPYDPDLSRKLLADAGYPNGFKATLWTLPISREYMPDGKKAAALIQQDLKAVGIQTDIVTYPWNEYINRLYRGEHDMAIMGWIADIPDPDNFFFMLDKTVADHKQSNNIAFYRSEEMYQLIRKGKTTTSPLERSKIYKDACVLFNRDLPWFVIAHSVVTIPMQKYVMDFQPYASYARRFNKVWLNK